MVVERRVFNRLPDYLKTDQNNRSTYVADDVMFEPERAGFLSGYVGDTSILSADDLARLPAINESTASRQKYQVSLGAVLINPDTGVRTGGAFYTDLVGQISTNGGITDDPNRLFETAFYAWTPPIDYDKHINFSRYYWTGAGNADVNGEYVTKEVQGSQTTLYESTTGGLIKRIVTISTTAPSSPAAGDLWENSSDTNRIINRWDGSGWVGISYVIADDLPTTAVSVGTYVYITRTGPDFNRPLLWKYTTGSGRWIAQPVVVGPMPDAPTDGMVWEDSTVAPNRPFKIYQNGGFIPLVWTPISSPSGIPTAPSYGYDLRNIDTIADGWSKQNHWRHFDDLSPKDREALQSGDQATRPIVEFWAGMEIESGNNRTKRNESPKFSTYKYDATSNDIIPTGSASTVFQYQVGTGNPDSVLGFPLVFNTSGEFQFELTLETDKVAGATGYKYFKDTFTGLVHSVWAKSPIPTKQSIDTNGLADIPQSITHNPNHEVLTVASRSRMLGHMGGVIKNQTGFSGNENGLNNYRWTDKVPTVGASIIDCETSLLRSLSTLQKPELSIPDVIRKMSRDYNRVMNKFQTRMNQRWEKLELSDPTGTLYVTPKEAVDAILTELFVGRGSDFAYYNSGMGVYTETQIQNQTASVYGIGTNPIFVPPSPPRTGSAPAYKPEKFTDIDGVSFLRGHDGSMIRTFGDDRDKLWLELQNRFYAAIPSYYRDETTSFSSRHTGSNFSLADYYGNMKPQSVMTVSGVVSDYSTVSNPTGGDVYFDSGRGAYAYYNGSEFVTTPATVDDIFYDKSTTEYFIYNGFFTHRIDRFNQAYDFDYSFGDFKQIMRREFERWAVSLDVDFITNNSFDENNPFTWNYRHVGLEGHYFGIYQRLYRTSRPHSHPWEIAGYTVKPDWWDQQYPPTSTATDGTGRWKKTHPMWADIQNGVYAPLSGSQSTQFVMIAPIPVDGNGELLDPIAAGIVSADSIIPSRRDDGWVYGDGAPAEQDFIHSPQYAFAISLCGYLMKTGVFVDTVWSELYIDIGHNGTNKLWGAPHVIHKDIGSRPTVNALPVHLEVGTNGTEVRLGINAWISEYVRSLGQSVTESFGDTVRNTKVSIGWKTAGFISRDRTSIHTLGGVKIPYEDVHTVLHRSPPSNEFFGSGVLVTRDGTGYRVFGFDLFRPYFEVDVPVAPIAGGQVELREEFVATSGQHAFTTTSFTLPRNTEDNDTAKLGVLVNGMRLKPQHVKVTGSNTFEIESIVTISAGDKVVAIVVTTQSNPSTKMKQFSVNGVAFPYIDSGQGKTQKIEYGRYFDTSTDVINFMLGYGRKLVSDGWVFDDAVSTGVTRDWLYGAKAFATWVMETKSVWNTTGTTATDFFYSPFSRKAKYVSEFGQVLDVESVQNGAYGILNKSANPISPDSVFTSRIGNELVLSVDKNADDMYGIRILVVEDQHVVFLSNITKFNDLLYDPIIGLSQKTLRVDSYRSESWNGRLEADGFIINQGQLLPNAEKQAKDFIKYYDRVDTLDDPVKRDQARELYGWYPNAEYTDISGKKTPMMDAIGADDRSQFDYHRGMLNAKGTMRPIIAFSKGSRLGEDNVVVTEDWAWRWAEFGDTRRSVVRFSVGKSDFKDQVQPIEFNKADKPFDNVIQVEEFDRNKPNDGRWIIPPTVSENSSGYTYSMPIDQNGDFDRHNMQMAVTLFNKDTNETIIKPFHYDPSNFLFDPLAMVTLDYAGSFDPAKYTDGSGAATSDGIQWGPEQVGKYWWDLRTFGYVDFRGLAPDYNAVAREWGKLVYYRAKITRTNEIVTVETISPYTGLSVPHGLKTDDEVKIYGADQSDYNGFVKVKVVGSSKFEFVIQTVPDSPATGDIFVQTKFIDVHEWVESPVPPSGWDNYIKKLTSAGSTTGKPIDGDATSYVTQPYTDTKGKTTNKYYFWIKGNTGDNKTKALNADQMVYRLQNPTGNNLAWFGLIDSTHMIVFVGGAQVHDNYAIEVIQDASTLEHHTEWLLLSEGDRFNDVPQPIQGKLLDSIAGQNSFGATVPSPMLADTEKFGSGLFPIQTVYPDRAEALKVGVKAINAILARKKLDTVTNLSGIAPVSAAGTYWKKAEYRKKEYEKAAVLDVVANVSIRDQRLVEKRYLDGDLVKVINSSNKDLWDQSVTDTTYVVKAGVFEEVGANNQTIALLLDENSPPSDVRDVFTLVYPLLSKEEQNSFIFSLLYEMMRQTPDADWFMKTSYISMQVFDTVGNSPFVRPNEVEAIISNTLDTKPYRTKLRSSAFTYALEKSEDVGVKIDEFPDKKISLWFDRLNCQLNDENSWDTFAWDSDKFGWDKPLWDLNDLGRKEFYSLGVQPSSSGPSTFIFPSPFDPKFYTQRMILRENGNIVNPPDVGLSYYYLNTHEGVSVIFSAPLGPSYTVEVEQSSGLYDGNTPSLGPEYDGTLFQAAPSSYKHHVARMLEAGIKAPFPSMENCYTGTPSAPDERIPNDVTDSVTLCVTTDWTPSFAGWDATPWDSADWDMTPKDIGNRTFFMTVGAESIIPAGLQVFATSETVVATDTRFVVAGNHYEIGRVDLNGVAMTEGTDFKFLSYAPWVIEMLPRPDLTYVADGVTTSFDISAATYGIDSVFQNGTKLTQGVEFNIVGNDVVFVQPAPTNVLLRSTPLGRYYEGDGATTDFLTNQSGDSLHEDNVFVFVNDKIVDVSDYSVLPVDGSVSLNTPPVLSDPVILFSLGNNFANNSSIFAVTNDTGDGATTTFTIGNNANSETSLVFVDGVYQVYGADYTVPTFGEIDFVVPPASGAVIHTRTLNPSAYISYDMEHIQFVASGAATDAIPNLSDADPDKMMVFVDDQIQNAYASSGVDFTLTNGNPDVINWATPPVAGTTITVRVIRSVAIDQTVLINVEPTNGDVIKIVQTSALQLGDSISFYYNRFPVGKLGSFVVNSSPTSYDVVNGEFVLDNLVLNGFINLTYLEERRSPPSKSILVRMKLVVDRVMVDHLQYDGTSGFEEVRTTGLRVLNTTTNTIYSWDGNAWNDMGVAIVATDQVLSLQDQQIVEYNGTAWSVIFSVGDTLTTPPVLSYPKNGLGIVSGTYALGQTSTAATDFPEAYQIIQHEGGC